MKNLPLGAEFVNANGRTDTAKLIITFRNFAKAPKERNCTNAKTPNGMTLCT